MNDRVIPLAAGFAEATQDQWLAMVEKTLKGASADTLVSRTADGLARAPLYTSAEAVGFPLRPGPNWDIRGELRHPDPAEAGAQALQELTGGAASLLLKIDPSGADGVAVGSADTLARVLDGVMLDLAPVALDAGFLGVIAADWLGDVAKASPVAALSLHLDPLTALAEAGSSPGPIDSHLIAAANAAVRLGQTYPKASLFLATGRAVHEGGGTEAQELAFACAAAVAYAKALVRAGMPMADAFGRITFGVSVEADYFLSIAKLRAARALWARIASACGADAAARVEARSSRRMLTTAEPWTNLIRLTAAGFAAAVGGADAVVLGAFTDALGLPTAFARRQARNTQLILMEEAHLGRVSDPAAGTWYIEDLTRDLAEAAWRDFQAIEATGGAAAALTSGLLAGHVTAGREALAAAIAAGERRIVGVTDFKSGDPAEVEVAPRPTVTAEAPSARLPGPDSVCPPLTPVRVEMLVR